MGKRTERDLNTPSLGVQTREKGSALVACNADEVVAGSEADPVEDRALLAGFGGVGPASTFRLALNGTDKRGKGCGFKEKREAGN